MNKYKVIGVMSGTSLDGIDIAYCEFQYDRKKWKYKIIKAETLAYPNTWTKLLRALEVIDASTLAEGDMRYGKYVGGRVKELMDKYRLKPDFIASHGHTLFHRPDIGFTFQLGSGAAISAVCGLPVVCDFRRTDIALGGQGAPLVPIGDKLLFAEYDACLNIGGFANISFDSKGKRLAFDCCPANIVLNHYSERVNKRYDEGGKMARRGKVIQGMLEDLNRLPHYHRKFPASLGKEWVVDNFYSWVEKYKASVEDTLRTLTEHAAFQVARSLPQVKGAKKVLVTGGGAYNEFLIERIKEQTKHALVLPNKQTIEFKEALIFAFLGVLRMRGEINALKSVTGATKDNIGGCVYL